MSTELCVWSRKCPFCRRRKGEGKKQEGKASQRIVLCTAYVTTAISPQKLFGHRNRPERNWFSKFSDHQNKRKLTNIFSLTETTISLFSCIPSSTSVDCVALETPFLLQKKEKQVISRLLGWTNASTKIKSQPCKKLNHKSLWNPIHVSLFLHNQNLIVISWQIEKKKVWSHLSVKWWWHRQSYCKCFFFPS
jgi:hypothetical protein